jgi:hypothetical protein
VGVVCGRQSGAFAVCVPGVTPRVQKVSEQNDAWLRVLGAKALLRSTRGMDNPVVSNMRRTVRKVLAKLYREIKAARRLVYAARTLSFAIRTEAEYMAHANWQALALADLSLVCDAACFG